MQIEQVLRLAGVTPDELDAIAVGVGPGAFTGLRVGLATAQTLGHALQIPVHGMSTLDVLAFATGRDEPFAVITDARRREYFWATYSRHDARATTPTVGTPATACVELAGLTVMGPPGTPAIEGLEVLEGDEPSGAALCGLVLARLDRGQPLDDPTPLYLRRPDVTPSVGPKSVLA